VDPLLLTEYRPATFPAAALTPAQGERLWRDFGRYVDVDAPSFKTGHQWCLRSKGWVGDIPLDGDVLLRLQPKVALSNLFAMIEAAHGFKAFKVLQGLTGCGSLEEYFDRLAALLARLVLERGRKGYHRRYLPRTDTLQVVRGRLDVGRLACRPWDPAVRCDFREHTGNIDDNRILAWTLRLVLRTADCRPETRALVRHAFRTLDGLVEPTPMLPADCVGRFYDRLNADYEPMHALCRFFLEFLGPALSAGDRGMLPFLVDMNALYERFVAGWMRRHLGADRHLDIQHSVQFGEDGGLKFAIDLVLRPGPGQAALAVLDTKYKVGKDVEEADVQQVVAYAVAMGCRLAFLVYPEPPTRPVDARVGDVRVRSVVFGIGGDLDQAGRTFLEELRT